MSFIFHRDYKGTSRLDGKTAIITGCNSGIGKETAREFYKRGARVIMACRDMSRAEAAAHDIRKSTESLPEVGKLVIIQLDLASFDSIKKCAKEILDSESAIHILVNNAGVAACAKQLSRDGYELQFQTNHLGHFLLTLLLLPRLIKSKPARIINVSSLAHVISDGNMHFDDINLDKKGYTRFGAYGRSKLANILFAKELGKRLEGTGVTAHSMHPGLVATDIGRNFLGDYYFHKWMLKLGTFFFLKTSLQGCQTILHCSLDEKCGRETGLYYTDCSPAFAFLGRDSDRKAKELWEESTKLVGLEHVDVFTEA